MLRERALAFVNPGDEFRRSHLFGNGGVIFEIGEEHGDDQFLRGGPTALKKRVAMRPHFLRDFGRDVLGKELHQIVPLLLFVRGGIGLDERGRGEKNDRRREGIIQ